MSSGIIAKFAGIIKQKAMPRKIVLWCVLGMLITSCNINNSIMLKVDRDFEFDSIPENRPSEYIISPNDALTFRLFANDGHILIEMANSVSGGNNRAAQQAIGASNFSYVVEMDSMVNLPILGRVKLAGLSLIEAEEILEDRYSTFYIDPFVMLNIRNRRVVVFPGNAGDAMVVGLTNNNTTLIEVLAQAGGLAERGKATDIRVIRKVGGTREVYNIDLSTIDGLANIDMIIQANDVIYVEPTPDLAREILKDITPVITLFNSAILVYITLRGGL